MSGLLTHEYSLESGVAEFVGEEGDVMRSNEELMKEIKQRKSVYLIQKQIRRLSVVGLILMTLLISTIFIAPRVTGNMQQHVAYTMGATILGPEIGGYVLVALLAFSLGIIVTLIIKKYQAVKKQEEDKEKNRGDT